MDISSFASALKERDYSRSEGSAGQESTGRRGCANYHCAQGLLEGGAASRANGIRMKGERVRKRAEGNAFEGQNQAEKGIIHQLLRGELDACSTRGKQRKILPECIWSTMAGARQKG